METLIKEWQAACEKYFPGPRVAPRITQNWDKEKKLPYGKYANIRCIYDENLGTDNYCKFSLREFKPTTDLECQATEELHQWIKTKDFSEPSVKYRCKDCGIAKETIDD